MTIEWQIGCAAPEWMALMQTAADAALIAEGIEKNCAIMIRLTNDAGIQAINAAHRGIDQPTDVLSFPSLRFKKGATLGQNPSKLKVVYDDALGAAMLGDIILSVPTVLRQAAEYGNSAEREAAYMVVHAVMHLMGYDHMAENEKREMRRMEEKALGAMGLSEETTVTDEALLALARAARERSYSPYSKYRVGAALLCADGRVYQGCNIENASFGLTNCGERTAVFKAVSDGAKGFTAIAIASDHSAPWPCGACRQVLNEFAPDIRVLVTWGDGQKDEAPLSALLPHGFGPKDLASKDEGEQHGQ